MPEAQVAKNFLDDTWVVDDGDDPHRVLADGTAQRIGMPNAQDEIAPALGGEFGRGWRRDPGAAGY